VLKQKTAAQPHRKNLYIYFSASAALNNSRSTLLQVFGERSPQQLSQHTASTFRRAQPSTTLEIFHTGENAPLAKGGAYTR
jgi:hypothetical protein